MPVETKDEDTKQLKVMCKLVIFCSFSGSPGGLLDRQLQYSCNTGINQVQTTSKILEALETCK